MEPLIWWVLGGIVAAWNLYAPLRVLTLREVPWVHRRAAARCFLGALVKNWYVLPFNLLAPIGAIYPVRKTPFTADKLSVWDDYFGNDDDLNGDQWYKPGTGPDWNPYWVEAKEGEDGAIKMADIRYTGRAYYAKRFAPRSRAARYAWVGLRNRASRLAQRLGPTFTIGEQGDRESWGSLETGRGTPGWVLNRAGPWYQLYMSRQVGERLFLWTNYGYKVGERITDPAGKQNPDAMVVGVTLAPYMKVS